MLGGASISYMLWEDALDSLSSRDKSAIGWDIFGADEETMKRRFIHQAQAAWKLVHLYNLSWEWKDYREFDMPRFFHKWGCAYAELCAEKKLIDESRAFREFNRRVYDGSLTPAPSLWTGWIEEMPPLYRRTWDLCASHQEDPLPSLYGEALESEQERLCYSDEEQELRAVAAEVKEAYERNPAQSVGIVIPGLEQMWHLVRRIFRDAFQSDPLESQPPPFNMSWGETLQSHPLIGDLLRLLELTQEPRPPADFLDLFQSPYIRGAEQEQAGRFRLKEKVVALSLHHRSLSLSRLLRIHSIKEHLGGCPQLRSCLENFLSIKDAFTSQASPHHWAMVFNRQAEALGWGTVSRWSSQEIYLRDRWDALLDSLYGLHRVLPVCSRFRALSFLQAAAQAVFQPYRSRPQIHILGLREAEGLRFDKLFVCRMNENAIPRPAANFFIPYRLGQAGRVPGYGIELSWAAEERLIQSLSKMAPQVKFTYAKRVNDEERLIHPLLRQLREDMGKEARAGSKELPPVEELEDNNAPSVAKNEKLSSLVALVQHQAACPFKSFARFRLKVEETPTLAEQLTPQNRGTMAHRMLKEIWSELKDKQRLLDMKQEELRALIAAKAHQVVADWSHNGIFLKEDMIAELEQRHLKDIARKALEYEKEEPRSFRIHALEEKKEVNFCGYDFSVYIDRIDALDEKGTMILDYKITKRALSPASLMDERPDEPQLLIYSMLVKDIKAFGLMVLSLKQKPFVTGITLADEAFSSSKNWRRLSQEQMNRLQQRPKEIFQDFLRGKAAVDPKKANTCRYCCYHSLCRIGA